MSAPTVSPYGQALGITIADDEHCGPLLSLDFSDRVLGRPGYLHGGALSGLLEAAAIAALQFELDRRGEAMRLKPVNIQVEFMRGGTAQRTFAVGKVTRAGRRVALVNAEAWQDDRDKPIALAQMKLLLSPAAE